MDFDFLTESIIPTQSTNLIISATGSLGLPTGGTAQRSYGGAGALRFNSDTVLPEFWNGSTWTSLGTGTGTVTSITISGSTGLTVSGSPITSSGTISLTLGAELQGLSSLSANGFVARTAAGTYTPRSITAGSGISISNGDGISGAPTISLGTVGSAVTNLFQKITTDSYGRVTATSSVSASDITTALTYTPLNKAGDSLASAANLTFSGGGTVTGLPAVTVGSTDATSKAYVDSVAQGLDPKGSVRAATTAAGTLASSFANGSIIDGVTLVTGDRILVKNQATASENGIYIVAASGAPTRAPDMNSWTEVPGAFVFIEEGTNLGDTGWVCTSNSSGTLGSTSITWVQFAGAGTYSAGTGLSLSGTTFTNTGVTSITAGTGISVSGSTGGVTITNAGVTSVSLSLPSIFTVSGSPVTTTGTLSATLASQTANTVLAAPSGSAGSPTFRSLVMSDLPIKLYVENSSSPTAPVASGTNSSAIGSGSTAAAAQSIAIGNGSYTRAQGGLVFANGIFDSTGDAQSGKYMLRNTTTTATATELFIDGVSATQRLVLAAAQGMMFRADVVAFRTDGTGYSAYSFVGLIKRDSTASTTAIVGSVSKTVIAESNTAWDANVTADTTNGSLKITVTGEASKTINWVAKVETVEVM